MSSVQDHSKKYAVTNRPMILKSIIDVIHSQTVDEISYFILSLLLSEYLFKLKSQRTLSLKPGLHTVVMVVSTVAYMFLTLFHAVLIHVKTLITTSQA